MKKSKAPIPVTTNKPTAIPAVTRTSSAGSPTVTTTPATATPSDSSRSLLPGPLTAADYPTLFSDIPDPDIIQVNGMYYMISTTMNMIPGAPIMKSGDLIHWQIVNYVYDTFADDNRTNLVNGEDMYRNGSWAASLRYNEADQKYYAAFNANGHGFFIYTTDDIENGTWIKHHISGSFHDPGLLFDNGKLYVLYGNGPCSIQEVTLNDGSNTIQRAGSGKAIIQKPSAWSLWEGTHAYKIGEYYYVMMIASPSSGWFRTQVCYRSKDLLGTAWEEKIVYSGGSGNFNPGLAQGGIVRTQHGDWYGFLFQDHNAVGRVPSIVGVEWQDDWPMMGTYDANGNFQANISRTPMTINLPDSGLKNYFYGDDDFDYQEGEKLKLIWQWNHNPQNNYWSVTDHPGHLRLTTDQTAANIHRAHNSLTQRTYGPKCVSETKISAGNIKGGDYAGLCAVGGHYAAVGVMCDENGDYYIFQGNGIFPGASEHKSQDFSSINAKTALNDNAVVSLKIEYDFTFTASSSSDKANFYYKLDGNAEWIKIGKTFSMSFSISTTFMGARTWLFNYATKETGGYVDFDYYKTYPY